MGDVLFVPPGWWYQAEHVGKTLTVSAPCLISSSLPFAVARLAEWLGVEEPIGEPMESLRSLCKTAGENGAGLRVEAAPALTEDLPLPAEMLHVPLEGLGSGGGGRGGAIRMLEATSSEQATDLAGSEGDADPFGTKLWPAAVVCAERLLALGVQGRTVLELGCGTGLVSVAALCGGASLVLATDRSSMSLAFAAASARANGVELPTALFDVTMALPLPSRSSPKGGTRADGEERLPLAEEALPDHFDIVAFSDVLYWEEETRGFCRRACEALLAGSTVVVSDPGRRREDFIRGLHDELATRGYSVALEPETPAGLHPEVMDGLIDSSVRSASELFVGEPFVLVLEPSSLKPLEGQAAAVARRTSGALPGGEYGALAKVMEAFTAKDFSRAHDELKRLDGAGELNEGVRKGFMKMLTRSAARMDIPGDGKDVGPPEPAVVHTVGPPFPPPDVVDGVRLEGPLEVPAISVQLCTFDRPELLRHALELISKQAYSKDLLEVVIVDDSPSSCWPWLSDRLWPMPVTYFWFDGRVPIGRKRNWAAIHSRGSVVIHWDDDDWFGEMRLAWQVAAMASCGAQVTLLSPQHVYSASSDTFYRLPEALNNDRSHPLANVDAVAYSLCTLCYKRSLFSPEGGVEYPGTWAESGYEDTRFFERLMRVDGVRGQRLPPGMVPFVYVRHGASITIQQGWMTDEFLDGLGCERGGRPEWLPLETHQLWQQVCRRGAPPPASGMNATALGIPPKLQVAGGEGPP